MIEWKISKELVSYQFAIRFMEERVEKILRGEDEELVWFLEHHSVYTAGTSAQDNELLSNNFPVYKTGRGGKYTYHGPGQKIVYLALNLKRLFLPHTPDIRRFVQLLEKWIIVSLKEIGIESFIKDGSVGIWVSTAQGDKKVAAIGLRVRKWIAYHGIAINFAPNLDHFYGIVPCGIKEFGVTSIQDLGNHYDDVKFNEVLKLKFFEIFV